jgi:hypothetical protein
MGLTNVLVLAGIITFTFFISVLLADCIKEKRRIDKEQK